MNRTNITERMFNDRLSQRRFQITSGLISVLFCFPILLSSGCDMGTYNKRLNEKTIVPAATEPSADSDTEANADQDSNEESER